MSLLKIMIAQGFVVLVFAFLFWILEKAEN